MVIEYDGSCDDGSVTGVTCFGSDGAEVNPTPDIIAAVEGLVCDILDEEQAGWEIDGGSFGEVVIDVATGAARFSHSGRSVTYPDDEFVVSIAGDN